MIDLHAIKERCEAPETRAPWMVFLRRDDESGITTFHVAEHVAPGIALDGAFWEDGDREDAAADEHGYLQPDANSTESDEKTAQARFIAHASSDLPTLVRWAERAAKALDLVIMDDDQGVYDTDEIKALRAEIQP